jgi:hypothetical protein
VKTADREVYAEMRETENETVLVIGNFSETPKPGVAVSVESGAIRPEWTLLEELEGARVTSPKITAAGGFEAWQPLAELAPESVYVLRWRR